MTAPVLDWRQAAELGAAEAGGKGAHLGRMAGLGVPVPDGFVVAASHARDRRPGTPLPAPLLAAVWAEIERRGWAGRPLAVRSSAVDEDSAAASFAGIHLSRLNVIGADALGRAMAEVWDSAWSDVATAYRRRLGLPLERRDMAVVVMPLLEARASGVAFTCDPASGREDHVVINAHWGLGEALVGGATDGDLYRLELSFLDDSLTGIERRIGAKTRMTRTRAQGGTELADTPPDLAAAAVLSPDQAVALGHVVLDAATALDFARPLHDLEWVWDGTRFWIVQARPITAPGRHTYDALRGQPALWSRGNTREVLPDPLSPLEWNGSRALVNRMLSLGWRLAGFRPLPGIQRAALFHGRLYLEAAVLQWEAFDAIGFPPKALNDLLGGHQPEIAVPAATLRQRLRRLGNMLRYLRRAAPLRRRAEADLAETHARAAAWRAAPLPADRAGMAALLREQIDYVNRADHLMFLQGSGGGGLSTLVRMLDKRFPGEGHALAAALMAGGEPSVTARQSLDMMELARIAAQDDRPALDWLRRPDRGEDWRRDLPPDSPFATAFARFLDRYGHRAVKETYMRMPRWRERPGYVLDVIAGLADGDVQALRHRQQETAAAAWRRLDGALPRWLRLLLRGMVRTATRECNDREAARSALVALLDATRRPVLEIARRLHAEGGLDHPDDVFNLTRPELLALAEGRLSPGAVRQRTGQRRRRMEQWAAEREPEVIALHVATTLPTAGDAPRSGDGGWRGTAVGAGRARGRPHVAREPGDGTAMAPGDILVAPGTDPAWTPLFLKAGGLVMETGGFLSHGAIVAREFGIPAVVNLPGIVDALEGADLVEVDGDRATVRRLP